MRGARYTIPWQCEVLNILYQLELDVALEEKKPYDIDEKEVHKNQSFSV